MKIYILALVSEIKITDFLPALAFSLGQHMYSLGGGSLSGRVPPSMQTTAARTLASVRYARNHQLIQELFTPIAVPDCRFAPSESPSHYCPPLIFGFPFIDPGDI